MDRIPPISVVTKATATAVARRACGVLLFATHAISAGEAPYVPVTEKKRDAYLMRFDLLAV